MNALIGVAARADLLARFAQASNLGRVVEFGCGTGYLTGTLAEKAASVVATDLSPAMLDVARKKIGAPNVTFQAADCRRPSFETKSFDTAVLSLVLHFVEPEATLREMHRIVRPGGRIFIVNPGLESMGGFARLISRVRMIFYGITRYHLKPPSGFSQHLLAGEELCELLKRNGWDGVRMETISNSARPFCLPLEIIEAVRNPEFRHLLPRP